MTSSGIELATFWLVAQCLNQLRHRGPLELLKSNVKYEVLVCSVSIAHNYAIVFWQLEGEKFRRLTGANPSLQDIIATLGMDGLADGDCFKLTIIWLNFLTLEGPCIIFCNIYIHTFQRDTQCCSTDCLLMHRCQLYMFRTVTVHLQELLFRCCMCRLWYVVRTALSDTSRWYNVVPAGRIR